MYIYIYIYIYIYTKQYIFSKVLKTKVVTFIPRFTKIRQNYLYQNTLRTEKEYSL